MFPSSIYRSNTEFFFEILCVVRYMSCHQLERELIRRTQFVLRFRLTVVVINTFTKLKRLSKILYTIQGSTYNKREVLYIIKQLVQWRVVRSRYVIWQLYKRCCLYISEVTSVWSLINVCSVYKYIRLIFQIVQPSKQQRHIVILCFVLYYFIIVCM